MMMRTGGTEAGREKLSETIETVGSVLLLCSQHSSHLTPQSRPHTTPTLSLSCHLNYWAKARTGGLVWSYSFSHSFIRNFYFYDVIWCEVAQLQNHMMKKRLTVINFVLSHLFLFTLESIFHAHYITLYVYFCNKKNIFCALLFT